VIRIIPLDRIENNNLKALAERRINEILMEFELEMELKRLGT
jgi:hypothetical protein